MVERCARRTSPGPVPSFPASRRQRSHGGFPRSDRGPPLDCGRGRCAGTGLRRATTPSKRPAPCTPTPACARPQCGRRLMTLGSGARTSSSWPPRPPRATSWCRAMPPGARRARRGTLEMASFQSVCGASVMAAKAAWLAVRTGEADCGVAARVNSPRAGSGRVLRGHGAGRRQGAAAVGRPISCAAPCRTGGRYRGEPGPRPTA